MAELINDEISLRLKSNIELVINEHREIAKLLDYSNVAEIAPYILDAQRVFLTGAGRSGFAMQSAAMRLMHLGLQVFVVGETTTPAIRPGDMLIAASGSGTTSSIVKAAEKAKEAGAKVVALSTTTSSALATRSEHVVIIPAAQKQDHGQTQSQQYAGSLFEQSVLFVMDALFQTLWQLDGTSAENLWKRHANLE